MAKDIRPVIEALLFATNEPVSTRKLANIVGGCDGNLVRKVVLQLQKEYDEQGRGFAIVEAAGGFQILSREDYSKYIRDLHRAYAEARLSQAALETLAVVAYKQPVLRAEVEAIRGVQAGPLLRSLIERGLIKIVGRADTLGRPALYGTTSKFLERFMLKSLKELPSVEAVETNAKGQTKDESIPLEEQPEIESPEEAAGETSDSSEAELNGAAADESPSPDEEAEPEKQPVLAEAEQEESLDPQEEILGAGSEEEPREESAEPGTPQAEAVEVET